MRRGSHRESRVSWKRGQGCKSQGDSAGCQVHGQHREDWLIRRRGKQAHVLSRRAPESTGRRSGCVINTASSSWRLLIRQGLAPGSALRSPWLLRRGQEGRSGVDARSEFRGQESCDLD